MSMKFKEFTSYLSEAFGIFSRNLLPIIFVAFLVFTLVAICIILLGYSSLLILSSESVPTGLSIDFSSYSTMVLVGLCAFIILSIITAFYSSIISIYAFYIRFKSDDENYQLFFSLIKEHLWKVMKVSMIVWIRVFIGTIFFIIPGIVLAMRYAAINYFVILENSNFTTAKVKSIEVMNGFKIALLLFYLVIYALSLFLDISKDDLVNGDIYSVLYLILSFLFQGIFFILYSVVIYTICKNEAYKNFVPTDQLANSLFELAYESGKYSRYKQDVNILEDRFKKLYQFWIKNSFNKTFADKIFYFKENENIVGFVTLKINNDIAKIGLIAVSPNYQGKGIGKKLIAKTENFCFENNVKTLQIPTQMENLEACNFYKKMGYEISEKINIKHFWEKNYKK